MSELPRSHSICEPEIHEALNWDMDLIVACMVVIRRKLPQLLNMDTSKLEFDLVSLENPFGKPYPVIGIHSPGAGDDSIPHFFELNDLADSWVNSIGLEALKKEALSVKTVRWTELQRAGHITIG